MAFDRVDFNSFELLDFYWFICFIIKCFIYRWKVEVVIHGFGHSIFRLFCECEISFSKVLTFEVHGFTYAWLESW